MASFTAVHPTQHSWQQSLQPLLICLLHILSLMTVSTANVTMLTAYSITDNHLHS